ncbi:MAG: hypothetical protein P4L92_02205 [Rudaea sp.]|nr:hypothetical protein [Rudaea sp.]
MHDATGAAFASFERKWLDAYPENTLVAAFLPVDRCQGERAFGTLVHELEQAAFEVREPEVAAAKLAWWRQELGDAAAGNARHPITKILFSDGRTQAVDAGVWPAMAAGAAILVEPPAYATLADSFAAFAPFHGAVALAEHALFGGRRAGAGSDATLWTISYLLRTLTSTAQVGALLPLDLLARHGATRTALAATTPLRSALLRDYLAALAAQIRAVQPLSPPASLSRRVRTALDLTLISAAQRAADPLAYLVAHRRAGRWRSLLVAWHQARAMAASA